MAISSTQLVLFDLKCRGLEMKNPLVKSVLVKLVFHVMNFKKMIS